MTTNISNIKTGPIDGDPSLSKTQIDNFRLAQKQINSGNYSDAYNLLKSINHPQAKRWIQKLELKYGKFLNRKDLKSVPVKSKYRKIFYALIGIFIFMVLSYIYTENLKVESSKKLTQSDYDLITIQAEGNFQSIKNHSTCTNYPPKSSDKYLDLCGVAMLKFDYCLDTVRDWTAYNECLNSFNKSIKDLEAKGYKK